MLTAIVGDQLLAPQRGATWSVGGSEERLGWYQ